MLWRNQVKARELCLGTRPTYRTSMMRVPISQRGGYGPEINKICKELPGINIDTILKLFMYVVYRD